MRRSHIHHGRVENDAFRRAYLLEVAVEASRKFTPSPDLQFEECGWPASTPSPTLSKNNLDTTALLEVLEGRSPTPPRLSHTVAKPESCAGSQNLSKVGSGGVGSLRGEP